MKKHEPIEMLGTIKKPESVEDAKEWLEDVAVYLEKVPYASTRLIFAAHAIREYLNGEKKSLNHAFGLVQPRGRKKRLSKHFGLALKVFEERLNGQSWKTICDEHSFNDERELRRILDRCHDDIINKYSDELRDELMEDGL